MFQPTPVRRASLVGAAAMVIAAAFAPGLAAAQPYGDDDHGRYQDERDYDACQHAKSDHAAAGAVLGTVIGGIVGNAAGHGSFGGTALGAGIGAAGGAAVGSGGVDCNGREAYDDRSYDAPRYYGDDRYDEHYDREGDYDAPRGPEDADGCTYANSPIYLPDGQVREHWVRVCRDEDGRYQPAE